MNEVLSGCFLCRYGGEEFVVVLDTEGAYEKLESLRKAIENEAIEFEGNIHKITVTVGIARYKKDTSIEKWIENADGKMYTGKNSGKNQTVI